MVNILGIVYRIGAGYERQNISRRHSPLLDLPSEEDDR